MISGTMKNMLSAAGVLACCGMVAMAQDGFTITGHIPGLAPAATKIELVNRDVKSAAKWHKLTGTVTSDSTFTIEGAVEMPTECELRLDLSPESGRMGKAISLMVENSPIEVEAAHIDSVPDSFCSDDTALRMRGNVRISGGGPALADYLKYQETMIPYERAAKRAHHNLYWADDKNSLTAEEKAARQQAYAVADAGLKKGVTDFINANPASDIAVKEWTSRVETPFNYTDAQLSEILAACSACPSAARVDLLKAAVDKARSVVSGTHYIDFTALTPEGEELSLSKLAGNGKYTLIDFWASWCGPCRAAIPHVRELNKQYGDKLVICAVSIDDDEEAWRKAMEQEKMTWQQMRLPKLKAGEVSAAYHFRSIPFLVLIDPSGAIITAGHDPAAIDAALSARSL